MVQSMTFCLGCRNLNTPAIMAVQKTIKNSAISAYALRMVMFSFYKSRNFASKSPAIPLGKSLSDKHLSLTTITLMNQFDQAEAEAADAITDYGYQLVKHYVDDPGDVEASILALFTRAIERILNREVFISDYYQ